MAHNPITGRNTRDYTRLGGLSTYGTPRSPFGHTLKTIGLTTRDLEDLRRG